MFTSKPEAYLHAIFILRKLTIDPADYKTVIQCINHIKQAFENHEENPCTVSDFIKDLMQKIELNAAQKKLLNELIFNIETSPYEKETLEQKFENPLIRRFESELPVLLLQHPTTNMMEAVKKVSQEIHKEISFLIENKNEKHLNQYLEYFMSPPISLGDLNAASTPIKPDIKEILKILEENNPQYLPEIMHAHFKFGMSIFRRIPIHSPERKPCGRFAKLISKYEKKLEEKKSFFELISEESTAGYKARSGITDILFCQSPLYRIEKNKGRRGSLNKSLITHQLGLLLFDQVEKHGAGLPKHHSSWIPDCIAQSADFKTRTVCDLLENDTLYVSGPSGMTAILLGQMEVVANLESVQLKQSYLASVVAYIVGGGFHSLHEVIAPAQMVLKLVPGYKITVPDIEHHKKAPPPNYFVFYELMISIDPEFSKKREQSWENYLEYFSKVFVSPEFLKEISDANQQESKLSSTHQIIHSLETKGDSKPNLNQQNKDSAPSDNQKSPDQLDLQSEPFVSENKKPQKKRATRLNMEEVWDHLHQTAIGPGRRRKG